MNSHHPSHQSVFDGNLSVVGKGKIDVQLHRHPPTRFHVQFKSDPNSPHQPHPCNPHQVDDLEWDLHYKEGHYVLVIKWNVVDVREIAWLVEY